MWVSCPGCAQVQRRPSTRVYINVSKNPLNGWLRLQCCRPRRIFPQASLKPHTERNKHIQWGDQARSVLGAILSDAGHYRGIGEGIGEAAATPASSICRTQSSCHIISACI